MREAVILLVATLLGAGLSAWTVGRGGKARRHRRRAAEPSRVAGGGGLALGLGPAVATAPLAALAFIRPWGPLPDTVGILMSIVALSTALVLTGQALVWWRGRRMRELYPDWLAFLSVALDFGIPLPAAAEVAAAGLEPPLRDLAERLALGLAGPSPTKALGRFATAVGTPEAHFVASLLGRQRHLGVPVASILLEEEGLLTRARWQERRARQGVVPYAFTAAVGVLLVNAAVLFLVPRAAALLATFRVGGI